MTARGTLMLVSDTVSAVKRAEVAAGRVPRPEYLVLERDHGVELADWTRVGAESGRSPRVALKHARWALARASRYRAILSDGEHVGIPIALGKRALGIRTGHVVIGHHLTTARKRPYFRLLHAESGMSKLILHSPKQLELAKSDLGIEVDRLALIPYAVDSLFWSPRRPAEDRLVLAVGREHRDYATFARAAAHLPLQVFVAADSAFSRDAACSLPACWPSNFTCRSVGREELRELYARASLVVVPLLDTDFQAGVTTMLEAMSMSKAVLVTRTSGEPGVIDDGATGVFVPAGDSAAMAEAMIALMTDRSLRARLGSNAREAVAARFNVDLYAARLAAELEAAREES